MPAARFRFPPFVLDADNRLLANGGRRVDLSGRYLDALILLVREAGTLITKERFLAEVWKGVPVTDEALTQCIRTLRRQLGDEAGAPRYIETVPKHGYRFIAPVTDELPLAPAARVARADRPWAGAVAGTTGAAMAGLVGGIIYGVAGASPQPGIGAGSILLVLMCVTTLVALVGGAGVSLGLAAAGIGSAWCVIAAAAGGMIVGGLVKMLGNDAFVLLLGGSPRDFTGAAEGAALGLAVGAAAWLGGRLRSLRAAVVLAGVIGAGAGAAISLAGGRLMAGSLELVARTTPGSRLHLGSIGALFGEDGLGRHSLAFTGALEGALFAMCIVGAMLLSERGRINPLPSSA